MADNVIKKVVDMRKGKTAILPSIVTNPELTGEEESLKSVEINGQKFTIGGGDGQLKLVATGTYDEETSQSTGSNHSAYFKLNNKLEDNKLYIVTYNNIFDNISITLLGKYYAGSINVTNETEDGVIPLKVYYQDEGSFDYIVFNNDGESVIEVTDINSTFYVYELPLIFGESSGGSGKLYQHNVCLYISDSNVELEVYITLYSTKGDTYGSIEEIIGDNKVYHLPCRIVDYNSNPNNYVGTISITEYEIAILGSPIGIDNDHEDNFQYIVNGKENVSQVEIYFDEYIYEV